MIGAKGDGAFIDKMLLSAHPILFIAAVDHEKGFAHAEGGAAAPPRSAFIPWLETNNGVTQCYDGMISLESIPRAPGVHGRKLPDETPLIHPEP